MVSSSSPKIDRDVLMQGIVEGIAGFESEFPLEDFKKGDYKQHPIITLLTCSDSRMPVNIFGSILATYIFGIIYFIITSKGIG